MSYSTSSVYQVIKLISENRMYLPAIQRKLVWNTNQICSLFDSIMRGFPIGTFLYWEVSKEKMNDYVFYKFIQDYHERNSANNTPAPSPETHDNIIGVLDGQQRLSAMYIALQGSYAEKIRYKRWSDDTAFPTMKLYLNLLYQPDQEDDEDIQYQFKFLEYKPNKEFEITSNKLWFNVNEVIKWREDPEIDQYYDELLNRIPNKTIESAIKQNSTKIRRTIRILHQRIAINQIINFFTVQEREIDEILNIFVRVNSGGTVLAKSDLLFSTIVATWQDARKEVEALLTSINGKGQGFNFDTDFIMRSCLCLCDYPVIFKVGQFTQNNVIEIQKKWPCISSAISDTIDILVSFGFNRENLTSTNSVIPIAYYFMKNGKKSEKATMNMKLYLIHSSIKKTFGAQTDKVLSSIRDAMRRKQANDKEYVLDNLEFDFQNIVNNIKLPHGREIYCTEDDLEDVLEFRKGRYTFAVLSLLYPTINFSQNTFHQDHIHPASSFSKNNLTKIHATDDEKINLWLKYRDELPNLQLLEGIQNKEKSKKPLIDWLKHEYSGKKIDFLKDYLSKNYIPSEVEYIEKKLAFEKFDKFFEKRRELMKYELRKKLVIK